MITLGEFETDLSRSEFENEVRVAVQSVLDERAQKEPSLATENAEEVVVVRTSPRIGGEAVIILLVAFGTGFANRLGSKAAEEVWELAKRLLLDRNRGSITEVTPKTDH